MECNKCDGLYCNLCLVDHEKKTEGRNSAKCPKCKQAYEKRPINRKLAQITLDKLKFKHECSNYLKPIKPLSKFE